MFLKQEVAKLTNNSYLPIKTDTFFQQKEK